MDNDLAKRIKEARIKAGLKQCQVADILSVSPPISVNRWENGKRKPSAEIINRMAKLYNTKVVSLIEGETENALLEEMLNTKKIRRD